MWDYFFNSSKKVRLKDRGSKKKDLREIRKKSQDKIVNIYRNFKDPMKIKRMNKNRNCAYSDFTECLDKRIILNDNFRFTIIGRGSFGVLIRTKSNLGDLAVKFIFTIPDPDKKESVEEVDSEFFLNMERELAYSYYMSEVNIGPHVYDSFYYNFSYGDLEKYPNLKEVFSKVYSYYENRGKPFKIFKPIKKRIDKIRMMEKEDSKYYSEIIKKNKKDLANIDIDLQCIVMKAYDFDGEEALASSKYSISDKVDIIYQMIELVRKQIYDVGLYCFDIKPGNFVVSDKEVKMVDFGTDFCHEKQIYNNYDNSAIIPYSKILTFKDLLYISNIIQVFMIAVEDSEIFINAKTQKNLNRKDKKKILDAFFNRRVFNIFFREDWKHIIKWYIEHARKNSTKDLENDPSNIMVHYIKSIYSPKDEKYTYNGLANKLIKVLDEALHEVVHKK